MSDVSATLVENGLRQINLSGRLAKGFNCTIKSIIKKKAKIVFLADDCDAKDYKELIRGLCKKYEVRLEAVPQKKLLGTALGMGSLKADGSPRRSISCGACALIKFGNVAHPAVDELKAIYGLE
jgi:small subunit ribosomal protein S12e